MGLSWKSWNLNLCFDKALSASPLHALIPTVSDKNATWGEKSGFSFPLLLRQVSPEHDSGESLRVSTQVFCVSFPPQTSSGLVPQEWCRMAALLGEVSKA